MKKRVLSLLLVVLMVVSLLPTMAFAADDFTITNGTPESGKETNHGYIAIDKASAAEGDTVTVTVNPNEGYELKADSLKVYKTNTVEKSGPQALPITPMQDTQDKTKYTFTMPAYAVVVVAEFEEVGGTPSGKTLPYSFDFETDMVAEGWTNIDADKDGQDWITGTTAYAGNGFGNNGSECAISQSYDNYIGGAFNADNWLFSPAITIPAGGATVSWYEQSQDPSYPDFYEVYICETNTSTDTSKMTEIFSGTAANPWNQRSVELEAAEYAGKTVYIAFRHLCYDCYFLEIDDFAVEAVAPAHTHIVSWYLDPNDDFAVAGIEIEDGGLYGGPAEPNRDGYTFGGWFTDRACTVPYDPNAPIHEDIELFPLWIPAPVGTPITAVDAQIPVPVAGQEPAGTASVTFTTTPEGAPLYISGLTWFYWDDDLPAENKWMHVPESDFVFEAGETYAVDIFVRTEEDCGYFFDAAVVGTVNGQPSDDSYDDIYQDAVTAYLSFVWTVPDTPPTPVDPCEGYTDIDRGSWYHSAAEFVIERGLMGSTKTDALTFEPNTKVSRAMVASILYRMAGSPAVEYKATFTDVLADKWFTNAIEWCAQNGLASGKGNGKFDPNGNVTRQELAVFMMKMAEYLGEDTSGRADLGIFADAGKVPAWAKTYLEWAVDAGLISGKANGGKTYLAPTDNATRAEFASIIMRFVQNIAVAK